MGTVVNDQGNPADQTIVYLVPNEYNPAIDSALNPNYIDTTTSDGKYRFTVSDAGLFNIQAVQSTQRTRMLIQGIVVNADTINVPQDTLKTPGIITAFLPDTVDTVNGYVFIKGSLIYKSLSKVISGTNEYSIILDSVPEVTTAALTYGISNNPLEPITISDTLSVPSGDTAIADAFVYWAHYTIDNTPLPSNITLDVYKASNGEFWFGSNNGCARFDGSSWAVYNAHNSGVPSNVVFDIIQDSNGDMWFATYGGVARFNGTVWDTFTTQNSGLPANEIKKVKIDKSGNRWFCGYYGAAMYNGSIWTTYDSSNSTLSPDNVYDFVFDGNGGVWFAHSRGVSHFDGTSWSLFNSGNSGLYADTTFSVFIDNQGAVWVGHTKGLSKFNGTSWTGIDPANSSALHEYVGVIVAGTNNDILFGSERGMTRYDGTSWTDLSGKRYKLLDGVSVESILVDSSGDIWVATKGDGIVVFGPTKK